MVSLDKLTGIYNNWMESQNLILGCALEESMEFPPLHEKTPEQYAWLARFIRVWQKAALHG